MTSVDAAEVAFAAPLSGVCSVLVEVSCDTPPSGRVESLSRCVVSVWPPKVNDPEGPDSAAELLDAGSILTSKLRPTTPPASAPGAGLVVVTPEEVSSADAEPGAASADSPSAASGRSRFSVRGGLLVHATTSEPRTGHSTRCGIRARRVLIVRELPFAGSIACCLSFAMTVTCLLTHRAQGSRLRATPIALRRSRTGSRGSSWNQHRIPDKRRQARSA